MKKAVLFDVDGTLVRADGVGRRALSHAMAAVYGLPVSHTWDVIQHIDFRGRTDGLLLPEIAQRLGQRAEGLEPRLVEAYLGELDRALQDGSVSVLPGVDTVLQALRERPDVVTGLLTGNVREAARRKLGPVGLSYLVDCPGGFGDDAGPRVGIAAVARERLAACGVPATAVVVVGDTQHDVEAARAIAARAVAVATGWTQTKDLQQAQPDLLCTDLSDPEPLWRLLDSL